MTKKKFLLLFFLFFPLFAYAQNIYISSEIEFKGQLSRLGIIFSSMLDKNESIITKIQTNNKLFTATFTNEKRIIIESIFTKSNDPAKLEQTDIVRLTSLYHSLKKELDSSILVQARLKRFIEYLIIFHPVNEFFDNDPNLNKEELEKEIRTLKEYTSFCDKMGDTIKGRYIIPVKFIEEGFACGDNATTIELNDGTFVCIEYAEVGPYNEEPCLGRCGPGCSDNIPGNETHAFTLECFNHDLCVGATGKWMGPCRAEFFMAKDSFFNAPDCQPPFY